MRNRKSAARTGCVFALALLLPVVSALAAREAKGSFDEAGGDAFAALRLLRLARELIEGGDTDRAVKMLETIIEQYPRENVRFSAYLELGKHYLAIHEQGRAIEQLGNAALVKRPDRPLEGEDLDIYLEAVYLTGLSHFQTRDYGAAFSELRKITRDYPNTSWANDAYYYIGMSHYAQQNWSRAVEALSRVGMFLDPDSEATEFVEAGARCYFRVSDADMPVIRRLGQKPACLMETAGGDRELLQADPAGGAEHVAIGSVAMELGKAAPEDGVLQVVGGDTLTLRYFDNNTEDGRKDVPRESRARIVSTATLAFMLGSFESKAPAVFLGQPVFVRLRDVDLDRSDAADTATVSVAARYRLEEGAEDDASALAVDVEELLTEEPREKYALRDELTITLTEFGTNAAVHTGVFRGRIDVARAAPGSLPDRTDGVLSCDLDDEVVITYVDNLHLGGEVPREVTATLGVSGEMDSAPRVARNVVEDPVMAAKKNLVEAEAYLELAKIYRSMGLLKGAADKAVEGLERVNEILEDRGAVPPRLRQDAFKVKWSLELAAEDWDKAMATCRLFSLLYPESPLVDEALVGMAKALLSDRQYDRAENVLREILALPFSNAKAEALFTLAELAESQEGREETAVRHYMECARAFPDSKFAGPSLAKVVDYHIRTGDLPSADELLGQVFMDYPDAGFLDSMLLKWVVVAYRRGDYETALEKCTRLLSDYPGSEGADKAAEILPTIRKKLNREAPDAE